jgi:hypothetical protein
MAFMCRLQSRISASPTACPASEVPPPRGTMGTRFVRQKFTAATTSFASLGVSTATGVI